MEQVTCKVDNQGRITLPVEWRKACRVDPGSEVFVVITANRLEVQTVEQSLDEARRNAAKYRKGKPAVEMLRAQRQRGAGQKLKEAEHHGQGLR